MIKTGLFYKLFHKKPTTAKYAPTLDGYTPIYTQFGTNIYASDVVQQALKSYGIKMKNMMKKVSLIVLAMILAFTMTCTGIAEEAIVEPAPVVEEPAAEPVSEPEPAPVEEVQPVAAEAEAEVVSEPEPPKVEAKKTKSKSQSKKKRS